MILSSKVWSVALFASMVTTARRLVSGGVSGLWAAMRIAWVPVASPVAARALVMVGNSIRISGVLMTPSSVMMTRTMVERPLAPTVVSPIVRCCSRT